MSYDADMMLHEAMERHSIHLSLLVAETAIWASPEVHRILISENGTGSFFPNFRRFKAGRGEKRGTVIEGVHLDANTYANNAIKRATGVGRSAKGFEACHIWPNLCYDERYHTAIANLVLISRALAGLSDH